MEEKLNDQEIVRRQKVEKLKELGIDPFGQAFNQKDFSSDIQALGKAKLLELGVTEIDPNDRTEEHKAFMQDLHNKIDEMDLHVSIAGRIMFIRKMGKASFFSLQDVKGKQQVYISINDVGEEQYNLFKMADIGDIVGVEGKIMLTQTGAITIKCLKYTNLTKSLRPLPEKFHGLTDKEERYRRRYVDLIMNEEAKRVALMRPRIIRAMQHYFDGLGFVEVETPVLSPVQGGATARPFITHHNTLNKDFYLRIATELPLKRLIVGGLERVYEFGRLFRNEGMDLTHNPEFTTVELYEAYGDLSSMMDITEGVIREVANKVAGKEEFMNIFNPEGEKIDVSKPFRKVTMCDMIKEVVGVDFKNNNYSLEEAKQIAAEHGVEVEKHFTVGHIIDAFFEKFCEEKLIQPTFLCGHPVEISPLTKKDPNDPRFVQRFELYIGGHEFANAYTELNDPIDQKQRFVDQLKERAAGNDEASEMDVDFLEALEYGMPPCGGVGIGVDRLIMFITEQVSIREVLLFPHMKDRDR
ncbi:MAG: lysine--tRNA ligase [Bacillales bacterium]|nr:lysine--tRNA ligase [Bacillales bacterium]